VFHGGYKKWLYHLHWNSSKEDLEQAKQQLMELQDQELDVLVQPLFDKSLWDNASDLLLEIGYPRVRHILYELLSWLQNMNWPGSITVSKLLVSVGGPLVPHIKRAFKIRDSIWHYWILIYVVANWDSELIKMLSQELYELASGFDYEGAHIESLRLLAREHILEETDLYHLLDLMKANEKNEEYFEELIVIENLIKNGD